MFPRGFSEGDVVPSGNFVLFSGVVSGGVSDGVLDYFTKLVYVGFVVEDMGSFNSDGCGSRWDGPSSRWIHGGSLAATCSLTVSGWMPYWEID